jgi:hypothetical protein
MTEEKNKVELENINKKCEIVVVMALALILVGGAIALWTLMMPLSTMLPDDEHITDQGMPVRDMDNATYTWTADEFEKILDTQGTWFTAAIVFLVPGVVLFYATLAIAPSEKKLHLIGCKKAKDYQFCPECGAANKYCPECGLKLSRLERD